MKLTLFSICMLTILIAGCATSNDVSDVGKLQIKVAQLERQLNESRNEVNNLKYELEELANEQAEISYNATRVDLDELKDDDATPIKPPSKLKNNIIRVSVSSKNVQIALKNAGYYSGAIDGKIGPQSRRAIAEFQIDHNLKNDGIVGKKTWFELKNYIE